MGSWVHVAARFDSNNGQVGQVSIFLDGDLAISGGGSRRPGSREEFSVSFLFELVTMLLHELCTRGVGLGSHSPPPIIGIFFRLCFLSLRSSRFFVKSCGVFFAFACWGFWRVFHHAFLFLCFLVSLLCTLSCIINPKSKTV